MKPIDIENLLSQLREFASERDWEQFHTPKNLVMALAGETGELLEIFQWLTPEQSQPGSLSDDQLHATREEIADILIYTLRLCDRLDIDVANAIEEKLALNARKYPIKSSHGNAKKHPRTE